jgi:uncharacterized membrane protein YphA (DoxX/SURF4 family)
VTTALELAARSDIVVLQVDDLAESTTLSADLEPVLRAARAIPADKLRLCYHRKAPALTTALTDLTADSPPLKINPLRRSLQQHLLATEPPPPTIAARLARARSRLLSLYDRVRGWDFLPPLAIRLFLAPIFWVAGLRLLLEYEQSVVWFGNPELGLGLPYPELLVLIAGVTQVIGGLSLLTGFVVRWMVPPLMALMLVAALSAHWDRGWQDIIDPPPPVAAEALGPLPSERPGDTQGRLEDARSFVDQAGYPETARNLVIRQGGLERPVIYLSMLLALGVIGAGRWSIDAWLAAGSGSPTGTPRLRRSILARYAGRNPARNWNSWRSPPRL